MRLVSARATLAGLVGGAALLAGCGEEERPPSAPPPPQVMAPPVPGGEASRPRPALARNRGGPRVETIVTGLDTPWELAFLPDGRALLTERPGRVRLLSRRLRLEPEPVATIAVSAEGEGGLLGLALDPDYRANRLVYLYYTTATGMEVARYRLEGERLVREATILSGVEAGPIHDSGRIAFGPDRRLYIQTGDAGQPELAQSPGSLNGKFLRMAPAQYRGRGGRPEIVSLGHRNPQGLDWQPGSDRLVASEHGPGGDDEVNLIRKGANYGWPEVQGEEARAGFSAPLAVYEDTIAPCGASFVTLSGSAWTGDFLIAALRGEQLRRVSLDGARVTRNEILFEGAFGRLRTVVEGPDGALYVLTSNRDGRGDPTEEDDRILRIVPPAD